MADEINVPIKSVYDGKGAKEAIKDAQKIEGLDPELTIKADDTKAAGTIKDFIKSVEKIDGETATLALAVKGADVQAKLGDVLQQISKLDAADATIDVKLEEAAGLKGDLDQIEAKVRELNSTPVDIDTKPTVSGLGKVHTEADQSRSVLANMAGNATQDLGELGGVAGTAGVAIGQLAEYASEGNINLRGLAAVAGPMLALAAATEFLNGVMEKIAKQKAFNTAEVKAFGDALDAGGNQAAKLEERLRKAGEIKFEAPPTNSWNFWFGNAQNAIDLLDQSQVSVEQFTKGVTGTAEEANNLYQVFRKANAEGKIGTQDLAQAQSLIEQYFKNNSKAARDGAVANNVLRVSQNSVKDSMEELVAKRDPLQKFPQEFERMGNALAANVAPAVKDVTTVMTGLGLSEEETLAIAEKLAETKLDDFKKSTEDAAKAQEDLTAAAAEFDRTLSSVDYRNADLAGATEAMQAYSEAHFSGQDAIIGIESAVDDFSQALVDSKENMKKTTFEFDLSTEAGRKNQEAMEGLATAIDVQLSQAFADSHGSFGTFATDADKITDQSLEELKNKFHLTAPQVEALRTQLGLTAKDWEARFKLAGDAEARIKLGLLQGSIQAITDKDWQAKIGTQIAAGDYQGAVNTVQSYYSSHPATLPSKVATPTNTGQVLDALDAYARAHPVVIPSKVLTPAKGAFDTGGVAQEGMINVAGEIGPEILNGKYLTTGPTIVPPGTRVTSRKRTEQVLRSHGGQGFRYASAPAPGPVTVNVNLPAGAKGVDVVRQVAGQTRRNGRRYGGQQVVNFARK